MTISSDLATAAATLRKQGVPQAIYQAVADASDRTGVSFSYLMHKASVESSFEADAQSRSSSAKGLYQFVENTWLAMVDRYGDKYGLGEYANKITKRADGSYAVDGGRAMRKEILALRNDPDISAFMAGEYANENASYLKQKLKRAPSDTDLYMAHFLGAGGAGRFLATMKTAPSASAADLLPDAARANRSVFYHANGREKTLQEVYASFSQRFSAEKSYYAMADDEQNTAIAQATVPSLPPLPREKPATPATDTDTGTFTALADAANATNSPAGAIPNASAPFMTSYLMAALEATSTIERNAIVDASTRAQNQITEATSNRRSTFETLFHDATRRDSPTDGTAA